ncbi:MAG: CoA transferase, partial [Woeseiaceae bacterium]
MGPLSGTKVVEIAGLGPAPFCGMMLADLGADVVLIERKTANPNASEVDMTISPKTAFYKRGKQSVALDLKKSEAVEVVLRIVEQSDVLIEGFRPGVMERLGLGPEVCLDRNKKLIYGRQTGWGQTGPLAQAAGHDINYIALAGALYYTGHHGEA